MWAYIPFSNVHCTLYNKTKNKQNFDVRVEHIVAMDYAPFLLTLPRNSFKKNRDRKRDNCHTVTSMIGIQKI